MKTYLDCIPCFFRQALEMSRMAGISEKAQRMVLIDLAEALKKFPLSSSPPEMARILSHSKLTTHIAVKVGRGNLVHIISRTFNPMKPP